MRPASVDEAVEDVGNPAEPSVEVTHDHPVLVWARFHVHLVPFLLAHRRLHRREAKKSKLWIRKVGTLGLSKAYGTPAGVLWYCVSRGFGVAWHKHILGR